MHRNSQTQCAWVRRALVLSLSILTAFQGASEVGAIKDKVQTAPLSISDLLPVKDANGTTLYLADETSGAIYSYSLAADGNGEISLDKFQKFYESSNIAKPSSLAYRDGKLLVVDKAAGALFEIDLTSKAEKLLQSGNDATEFSFPVSIAASEGGWVAVGKRMGQTIKVYDSTNAGADLPSQTIKNPSRLFFIDSNLFIFDSDAHTVYKIPNFNSAPSDRSTIAPSEIITQLAQVQDVAYRDGLFYFLGENGVSVIAAPDVGLVDLSKESPHSKIELATQPGMQLSRIVVNDDRVYIGDSKNRVIWLAALPSRISKLKLTSSQIVWLDSLTNTIYRTDRPAVQTSPGVIPGALDGKKAQKVWSGSPLQEPSGISLDALGGVYVVDSKAASIFSLTRKGGISEIYSGPPLVRPTDVAAINDRLYVIDSGARKLFSFDLTTRKIVEEYAYNDKILLPDRLIYDEHNLLALDSQAKIMDRFLVSEKTALEPTSAGGSWTQVEDSKSKALQRGERIQLGKLLTSVSDFSVANNVIYFIDASQERLVLLPIVSGAPALVTYGGLASSPNIIAADEDELYLVDGGRHRFNRLQVILPVSINFEGWTSEFLVKFYHYLYDRNLLVTSTYKVPKATSLEVLVRELNILPTGYVDSFQIFFCRLNAELCTSEQKREAGDSLTLAEGESLTLPDLKMVPYSARRGIRLPLDQSLYRSPVFRKYVNGPLGDLAEKFAPDNVKPEEIESVLSNLNPDYTGTDLLNERRGFFIIPVKAATAYAVVPKADLLNKESTLSMIVKQENITSFSPAIQSFPQSTVSTRSAVSSGVSPIPAPVITDLCRQIDPDLQSNAMRLVRYCLPSSLPSGRVVHIGVIDNKFNDKHPVFSDPAPADPPTMEIYVGESLTPDRVAISDLGGSSPTTSTVPDQRTEFMDIDHGTHIAALIGARKQPHEMIGFMPQSKLYGVESGELVQKVMDKWEFLRLFNVSLGEKSGTSPGPDGLFIETRPIIKFIREYPFALFIVAAGNNNQLIQPNTLASLGALDNVLVVGATNSPIVSDDTGILPTMMLLQKNGGGSNFHETLVGLVAPGENIKSALYNGRYGATDGTSQATALVTGAAAILMAAEPQWKIWQYKARLVASADLWPGVPPDRKIFAGNLNVQQAVLDTGFAVMNHDPNGICKGEIDEGSLRKKLRVRMPNGASPLEVPWKNILRLERSDEDDDLYTIIYYMPRKLENGAGRKNFDLYREQIRVIDLLANASFRLNVLVPSPNCVSGEVKLKNLKNFLNTFYPSPDDEN